MCRTGSDNRSNDIIVVVMRGSGFTPLEQTIMDSGQPARVVAMREDFQSVMAARYRDTIESLTGRKVVAFLSQAPVEPDITVERFFVDGPLPGFGAVESSSLRELALARGSGALGVCSADLDRSGSRRRLAPSRLGCRDAGVGLARRLLELTSVIGAGRPGRVADGFMIVERALSPRGDQPKDAKVQVGHGLSPAGSRSAIETAAASGSSRGASSGMKSANPSSACAPAAGWSGRPHTGQTTADAPVAAVKRSRQ